MRWTLFALTLLIAMFAPAESDDAELRLRVTDPSGFGVQATVEVSSRSNEFRESIATQPDGSAAVHHLRSGTYSIRIESPGFNTVVHSVEIRSALPQQLTLRLSIASAHTTVTVSDHDTLLDPQATGASQNIGSETIATHQTSLPGRAVADLVNTEPGWLYEGSAVLHPRGSEYQTQFVVDGVPLEENRSLGMGAPLDMDDIAALDIYTSDFPAEFGRKLGGVIEVDTTRDAKPGLHGTVNLYGGSFNTRSAAAQLQYGWGHNTLTLSGDGGATDWYLNPPLLENFTNRGTDGDFAAHYERDLTERDRLGLSFRREQTRFEIPNEFLQQAAGQLQTRGTGETAGILSYQHIFSENLLADLRFMARDENSSLASNDLATPIIASQHRSYDEQYAKGSISFHHGVQEWKAGIEADFATIHESFADSITDLTQFDPGTPTQFQFAGSAPDREQAAFVQDAIHLGPWSASLGLRWDYYRVLVAQNAVSPRIGVARHFRSLGMVVHASYDRIFQTPAMENLLLASSAQVATLNPAVLRLPVQPSHGNYYEIGASREFAKVLRADLNYFLRDVNNFADDDLLLNTSVSFPIAFRRASVHGLEAELDLPRWGRLSGTASYSWLQGWAYLPVTGGLFLGDDATAALANTRGRFPISQDQRNTVRTRWIYAVTPKLWIAAGAEYGSGLPVEFEGTEAQAVALYGPQIVDRVNFARGRVLPNFSFDVSAGATLWEREKKSIRLQADGENLNDRVNLINFAGLFSGNSVAPPRSWHLRMTVGF